MAPPNLAWIRCYDTKSVDRYVLVEKIFTKKSCNFPLNPDNDTAFDPKKVYYVFWCICDDGELDCTCDKHNKQNYHECIIFGLGDSTLVLDNKKRETRASFPTLPEEASEEEDTSPKENLKRVQKGKIKKAVKKKNFLRTLQKLKQRNSDIGLEHRTLNLNCSAIDQNKKTGSTCEREESENQQVVCSLPFENIDPIENNTIAISKRKNNADPSMEIEEDETFRDNEPEKSEIIKGNDEESRMDEEKCECLTDHGTEKSEIAEESNNEESPGPSNIFERNEASDDGSDHSSDESEGEFLLEVDSEEDADGSGDGTSNSDSDCDSRRTKASSSEQGIPNGVTNDTRKTPAQIRRNLHGPLQRACNGATDDTRRDHPQARRDVQNHPQAVPGDATNPDRRSHAQADSNVQDPPQGEQGVRGNRKYIHLKKYKPNLYNYYIKQGIINEESESDVEVEPHKRGERVDQQVHAGFGIYFGEWIWAKINKNTYTTFGRRILDQLWTADELRVRYLDLTKPRGQENNQLCSPKKVNAYLGIMEDSMNRKFPHLSSDHREFMVAGSTCLLSRYRRDTNDKGKNNSSADVQGI